MTPIFFDKIIERGILFLLIFTPLAMGTTRDWSIAVMEIVVLVVSSARLGKMLTTPEGQASPPRALKGLAITVMLAIALAVLQTIPLPFKLIALLSPGTAELYRSMLGDPSGSWRTLSIYPYATLTELAKVLAYGAVFIVVYWHYTTEERIGRLFQSIIFMGCFLAVLAILGKIFDNGRLLWVIPAKANWMPMGPYVNKNHFAGYMEMAIPLVLSYYLYAVGALSRTTISAVQATGLKQAVSFLNNRKIFSIAVGMTAMLLLTGALFMTLSRGGILGFSISMSLFLVMVKQRRSLRKKAGFVAFIVGLIAVAVVFAGWNAFEARFETAREQSATRLSIWQDALALARDHSLLGTGFGTFDKAFPLYQTRNPDNYFLHAENEYVEMLTDTGLAGFGLLVAMMFIYYKAVVTGWLKRHNPFVVTMTVGGVAACAAIIIHSFTDFNMRISANALLLTIIAALTAALVFQVPSKRGQRQRDIPVRDARCCAFNEPWIR